MASSRKPVQTKSDRMRDLYAAGKTVAEVSREVKVGYAFAYGVAKRAGVATTAAARRPEVGGRFAAFLRWMDKDLSEDRIRTIVTAHSAGQTYPATRTSRSRSA